MKILHCIPSLGGGGAERQLGYLASALAEMGHEVHIAHTAPIAGTPPAGVILHRLKCSSNYDPVLLPRLLRLVVTVRPDIIHSWILLMDILCGVTARLTGIPWVLREPSSSMAYPPMFKNRLRVLMARGASCIVSNSTGGDEYWAGKLSHVRRRIILNGLQVECGCDDNEEEMRDYLVGTLPLIVYAGRLTSDVSGSKNLIQLLDALAIVCKTRRVRGVLCGDGPQRQELERYVADLGLEGTVSFSGHLPSCSLMKLLSVASLFVSLSAYEGCPNTVMEAMQCGCPLLVSDIPAHRELLDSDSAVFVDPDDLEQVAEMIKSLLDDRNGALERADRARIRSQGWTVTRMASAYDSLYREIIR